MPAKVDITLQGFNEFFAEFKDETDRAAVIVGAAKIDYLLYQILGKFLVPVVGKSDELLEGDAPLSTFSARIHIAYRLGLIDAPFARALNILRRIRNSFAHEISGCSLNGGAHRDRVRELIAPFSSAPAYLDFKEVFLHDKSNASAEFCAALGMMVIQLEWLFDEVAPLTPSYTMSVLPSGYTTRRVERNSEGELVRLDTAEAAANDRK